MRPIDDLREKIDLWRKSTTDTALMSVLHDVLKQIDMAIYEMDHQEDESPWHRVGDELPEKFVNVILANKRGKHYDIDKGWWNGYSFDRCAKGIYRNVTHWMPLPEPPKEDADGEQ